jgi:amidase
MQQSKLRLVLIYVVGLVFSFMVGARGNTVKTQSSYSRRSLFLKYPDLYEATIAELQEGLARGHFSSVELVKVSHAASRSSIQTLTR